jgi:2-polyprenyl-3-methyl-5-hydroxy-6-metoxy-1,4-benzoquinol methylase
VKSTASVVADFDEIASALASTPPRHHLTPAERALLTYVPGRARTAIDVGCGDGVIARALAFRGLDVLGVDVSPRMIALARERTPAGLPAEYRELDITNRSAVDTKFDVVVSITMVHHLPLDVIVPRLVELVAPGGVLLVQDVVRRDRVLDLPLNIAGAITRRTREFFSGSGHSREVRQSYVAHGADETYLRPNEVMNAYARPVPEARVLHHLEWRYSVIWTRAS